MARQKGQGPGRKRGRTKLTVTSGDKSEQRIGALVTSPSKDGLVISFPWSPDVHATILPEPNSQGGILLSIHLTHRNGERLHLGKVDVAEYLNVMTSFARVVNTTAELVSLAGSNRLFSKTMSVDAQQGVVEQLDKGARGKEVVLHAQRAAALVPEVVAIPAAEFPFDKLGPDEIAQSLDADGAPDFEVFVNCNPSGPGWVFSDMKVVRKLFAKLLSPEEIDAFLEKQMKAGGKSHPATSASNE